MKYVYIVCSVNKNTGEITRVREIFSDIDRAVNRAIVLIQDAGNNPNVDTLKWLIKSYLDGKGEFWDRAFEAAVFARQVDSM